MSWHFKGSDSVGVVVGNIPVYNTCLKLHATEWHVLYCPASLQLGPSLSWAMNEFIDVYKSLKIYFPSSWPQVSDVRFNCLTI
jgi:hypothetical protein